MKVTKEDDKTYLIVDQLEFNNLWVGMIESFDGINYKIQIKGPVELPKDVAMRKTAEVDREVNSSIR